MARQTFFSFEYGDVTRAMVVRNSGLTQTSRGFVDAADFEKLERQGKAAVQSWIDGQLSGTSVTVVLVGAGTCESRWVNYEIEASVARGNGLLGVDISKIADLSGATSERCGQIPKGYPFYLWFKDKGYENLSTWIEDAAQAAGK